MKTFLFASCEPALWLIAGAELVLIAVMFSNYAKTKRKITLVTAVITVGLFIDAFLIALGSVVNAEAIRGISRIRFISHGALIPLLFIVCSLSLDLKKPWKQMVYAITLVLMVLGIAEACATVLGPVEIAGVSRMASIKGETPRWAEKISRILSFGTVFPLMGVGIWCWIKQKTPLLFLSGFFIFAFSALGPATGNTQFIFYISMYGELLMVLFLYLYSRKMQR